MKIKDIQASIHSVDIDIPLAGRIEGYGRAEQRHFVLAQVETDDALSGLIGDDSDDSEIHDFHSPHVLKLGRLAAEKYYPVIGPIYVEGCERGDTLAVEFDWMRRA